MKDAPTLADTAVRQAYKGFKGQRRAVPQAFANKITQARRFVLDDSASAFMADLSHASFCSADESALPSEQAARALNLTRQLARAPHALCWFEYQHRAFWKRVQEGYANKFRFLNAVELADGTTMAQPSEKGPADFDVTQMPLQVGFLVEQERETQFLATFVISRDGEGEKTQWPALVFPFSWSWTTDDSVPTHPAQPGVKHPAYLATGIAGACDDKIQIVNTPGMGHIPNSASNQALVEFTGELRYLLALLAGINDVPVGVRSVKPDHGFYAQHKFRRYLEHNVISIVLPKGRDPTQVARTVVAHSRRRAHGVRGHWRRDWRTPLAFDCAHVFNDDGAGHLVCDHCKGRRLWIEEHQRGDASLGFVTHDYTVQHEETPR